MKDRKGNDIKVGDTVFVIPDPESGSKANGRGFVREIKEVPWGHRKDKLRARIDDGPGTVRGYDFLWSAWVESARIELLSEVK